MTDRETMLPDSGVKPESTCDKACAILQATRDGNDLAPRHLRLVEMAVNGQLNQLGMIAFDALHDSIAPAKGGAK